MPLAGGRLTSRQALFGHGSSRHSIYICGGNRKKKIAQNSAYLSRGETRTCRMWCVVCNTHNILPIINVVRHGSHGPCICSWIATLAHLQDDTKRRPTNTSIRYVMRKKKRKRMYVTFLHSVVRPGI